MSAESLPDVSDDVRRTPTTAMQQEDNLVRSYGWYLRRVAVDVIARGATPILCAPVVADGAEQGRDEEWTKAIAVQQRIPFVDAPTAIRGARVGGLAKGGDSTKSAAAPETTATAVAAGLRGLAEDSLTGYFFSDRELSAALSAAAAGYNSAFVMLTLCQSPCSMPSRICAGVRPRLVS